MKLLDSVWEVFNTLRHHRPSKKYCPRCGSSEIHLSSSLDYWLTPRKYVCGKCGYVGPIVMELEKEEE
jgi:ribosomal protein S27AE